MTATAFALLVIGLLVGLAAGVLYGRAAGQSTSARATAERDAARREAEALGAELRQARLDRADLDQRLAEARTRAGSLEATLESERAGAEQRLADLREQHEQLAERFRSLSSEALAKNAEQFLTLAETRLKEAQAKAAGDLEQRRQAVEHLVAPLRDTLGKVESQLQALEVSRAQSQAALREQIDAVRATSEQLRGETQALVSALRKPQARGRWGELQLRRVVEVAGMADRCDFTEQVSVEAASGVQRPDLVVRLVGGKSVVVDSKVTLAAYLEAYEATDEAVREARLEAHAKHLRNHVDQLAAKAYWSQFDTAPEFVVLFVPGEAFLAPALDRDPTLLEHALAKRVHIATPTTLISMLRTVSYAWQQQILTDNARDVFDLGRELYKRLSKLGEHVDGLGRAIGRVVTQYNATVGSLERQALVSARKLHELKIVEDELASPRTLEEHPRPLAAVELVAAAEEASRPRALPVPLQAEGVIDPVEECIDDPVEGRIGDPVEERVDDPRYGALPTRAETAADTAAEETHRSVG